jgi:hypothetical protein
MNAPLKSGLKAGLATALLLASAAPTLAQSPYQPTDQYRRDLDTYQRDRETYQDKRADYADSRADYNAARAEYDRKLTQWNRDQVRYDRRYGRGAYVRVYGARPVWDETNWRSAYRERYDGPAPVYADRYGVNSAYVERRCSSSKSTVTGGVIGALLGAALGSNVAANGRGTEGAVLGAVVGGGIGAAVGNANDRFRCDNAGMYYSYADTIPYSESSYDRVRNSGRYNYSYYERQGCRLASAPVDADGRDYRYVRVCPDRDGRYRVTG